MDLKSATEGASWHPLTSLITFESDAQERELYLVPDWHYFKGFHYSIMLHELDHLWCARQTRLGWLLCLAASEYYLAWTDDKTKRISVAEPIQHALGSAMPLLEGLALYAQLDYEAPKDGNPLPSPLAKARDWFGTPINYSRFSAIGLLQHFREEEISSEGLLDLLFLDGSNEQNNHYLFGYLYVKAVEAVLREQNVACRNPAWFMQVAIKLFFSHPLLDEAQKQALTEDELIAAVHEGIMSVTPSQWAALDKLFEQNELRRNFDNWDLYAQLESGQYEKPVFYSLEPQAQFFPPNLSAGRMKTLLKMRASTALHLISWKTGKVVDLTDKRLVLDENGIATTIYLARSSALWVEDWERAINNIDTDELAQEIKSKIDDLDTLDPARQIFERVQKALLQEQRFYDSISRCLGRTVTIASFITITGGTMGAALWVDGLLTSWYAFSPEPFVYLDIEPYHEIFLINVGLSIDPVDRTAFARALESATDIWSNCRVATERILELLVGDPLNREYLSQRFTSAPFRHVFNEIKSWCNPNILRHSAHHPSTAFIECAERVFDLPGFVRTKSRKQAITFADLLPTLESPYAK